MNILLVLFVILLILLIYFVPKFIMSSKPKGYAKGIANTQLYCLKRVQKKYSNLPKEEQYKKVLSWRQGCSEDLAAILVDIAKKFPGKFNFRKVVEALVLHEAEKIGLQAHKVYGDLIEGINSVIPEDI